jgi:hypothetical protein
VVDGGMSGGCGGRCLGGGSLRGQGSIFLRDPISTGPASSLSRKPSVWLGPSKGKGTQRGVQIKSRRPSEYFPCIPPLPNFIILPMHTLRSRLRPPPSFNFPPNTPLSWTRSAQKRRENLLVSFTRSKSIFHPTGIAHICHAPRLTS